MVKHIHTLKREEIIRGFKSFDAILNNSKRIESDYIAAFVAVSELTKESVLNQECIPVEVGFLLSKKKLKNLTTGTD